MFVIGTWTIKDVHPTVDGKAQKVKVKVRVNLHGIMTVSSASLYESKESPEPETAEQQQQAQHDDTSAEQPPADGSAANGTTTAAAEVGSTGWTKKITSWFSGVRI